MQNRELIKIYSSNRKLYNTKRCKYITYVDVLQMVRSGTDVKIVKHGILEQDVTAEVLTSILCAEEKRKPRVTADVLKHIMRTGDGTYSGYIKELYAR